MQQDLPPALKAIEPAVLSYARDTYRGFAWGVLSLTFGVAAAIGIPVFDRVTWVPGFTQDPILLTGQISGWLAVGAGVIALIKRRERFCGILGIGLGVVAFLLLPALHRA